MSVVKTRPVRVTAVVGTSKNAGKTTTLNNLIQFVPSKQRPLGLVSIGVDGEDYDFWLGHQKPKIFVQPGDSFATAERALAASTAPSKIVKRTGINTILGELIIWTATGAGSVLLAGVRTKRDLKVVVDAFKSIGTERILIDGSYQRTIAAAPDVSDEVIVATGAVLGSTVETVAKETSSFVSRLRLPAVDQSCTDEIELLAQAVSQGRPWISFTEAGITKSRPFNEAKETTFGTPGFLAKQIPGEYAVLAFPGAITDSLLSAITGFAGRHVKLLITDPTKNFASFDKMNAFFRHKGDIQVLRPTQVLAITVNPAGIVRPDLPTEQLVPAIQELVADIPVIPNRDPNLALL